MMSQSREMGRLTKDLYQASELRRSATDATRQATKSMLMACATARGEMAQDYRMQAHKFLTSLTRDVAAHRNATMNKIARLASARRKAASQLRSSLRRQVGAIAEQTREFRNAAAQIVATLASAHQKMAKRQRASLEAGHRKLHANMNGVLGAIHADRMKAHEVWSDFKLGRAA